MPRTEGACACMCDRDHHFGTAAEAVGACMLQGECNFLNIGRGERKCLYALLYAFLVRQSLPYAHGASRVRASECTMAESIRVTPFLRVRDLSLFAAPASLPRRSRVAPPLAKTPRGCRPAAAQRVFLRGMGHE